MSYYYRSQALRAFIQHQQLQPENTDHQSRINRVFYILTREQAHDVNTTVDYSNIGKTELWKKLLNRLLYEFIKDDITNIT